MDREVEFDTDRAERFFLAWRRLHSFPPLRDHFDGERLQFFAHAFAEPYEKYRRSGAMTNVWQTAGLGHDELRNSQVLSWILDKFGNHGQGSAILERLIELVGRQHQIRLNAEDIGRNNYWTRTESLPLGDFVSRVDIEIESANFLIFIEVKIRAPETGDQLNRYVELAAMKAAGRPWFVIFLTTDGRKCDDCNLHSNVITISWRKIADILDAHTFGDSGNSFSSHLFRQFAQHARQLA